MKVLITGGYGNLGGWLLRHLSQSTDWDICVLSKSFNAAYSEFEHEFISCDIKNHDELKLRLHKKTFNTIFHLASVNDSFVDDYDKLAHDVNVTGTQNLLDTIGQACDHFIYLSTFQVYGSYSGIIDETHPTKPKNTYAHTHLLAEKITENSKAKYSIIRLTNSYGAPIDMNSSKWYLILNDLSRMAFKQHELKLNGNSSIQRDFISMNQVCHLFQKLALTSGNRQTYNLGGTTQSLKDVAKAVQLAYKTKFGFCIPIQEPKLEPLEESLRVDCQKFQTLIPYTVSHMMVEEASAIFDLLESQL